MDPFRPVPLHPLAARALPAYQSVYKGFDYQQDGNFDHFNRSLDVSHAQRGFWRYKTPEDDRKAMAYGFSSPDQLLVEVENGFDSADFDDIMLSWIKGNNDPNLRGSLSGTASQHLKTIHEIRQLLGLPMSSRGQVPTYPVSSDPRLKLYWNNVYDAPTPNHNVQPFQVANQVRLLGDQAKPSLTMQGTNLPAVPPSIHLQHVNHAQVSHQYPRADPRQEPQPALPASAGNHSLPNHSSSAMAPPLQQPTPAYPSFGHHGILGHFNPADAWPCSSSATAPALVPECGAGQPRVASFFPGSTVPLPTLPFNHTHNTPPLGFPGSVAMIPVPPLKNAHEAPSSFLSSSAALPRPPLNHARDISDGFPAMPHGESSAASKISPFFNHADSLVQPLPPPKASRKRNRSVSRKTATAPSDTKSRTRNGARDVSDLGNLGKIPCMGCGNDDSHKYDCPIGNLSFKDNLTTLDYGILTRAVEQFDPGPWTTHFDQFPKGEPEDPEIEIAGMADMIRNEDSYKKDATLHNLPDDLMIMLWALKTSEGVEVLEEQVGCP